MVNASKVLWGEGLFLRPQHFQRQDLYHETRLAETAQALHPYGWGIGKLAIDSDALSSGMLRILELRAIFPDGEIYVAPHRDPLPEPISLADLPSGSETVYSLALAHLKEGGRNSATGATAPNMLVRYEQHADVAPDLYTDASEAEIASLRSRVRVLSDRDPSDGYLKIDIARIRRGTTGGYEADAQFLPPAYAIKANPALFLQLRRLLDILRAKVDALYGFHREPSRNVIEFRSGDVASFWLLHTASAAHAGLAHLFHHPALHPERMYQELLKLAGSLMTFSKTYSLSDLPAYQHADPGPAFATLDRIIRDLLDTVISTRCVTITLNEVKPSYHVGHLDSDRITEGSAFYLGVSADMPAAELVDAVPVRFKVGAPEDVDKLVLSAMPGVPVTHAAQVPAAIPVRPGAYYFAIEPRGALYERMIAAHSISIYVPSGIRELQLELIAITE